MYISQVVNTSAIAVAWRADLDALASAPEFKVAPTEGVLAPGGTASVVVSFGHAEEVEREAIIAIEYIDAESGFDAAAAHAAQAASFPPCKRAFLLLPSSTRSLCVSVHSYSCKAVPVPSL